jgi:hypothetical protein
MKRLTIGMVLVSAALASGAAVTNDARSIRALYDAAGVRDPLVKPLRLPMGKTGTQQTGTLQLRQSRRADIERVLATCRIEGVVMSAQLRMAVINDRLLSEGDRLAPDVAVRIAHISVDQIVFALDEDTYDYKLNPPPETPR